ncbi:BRO1 domain-containing protein BROX-like protein [Diplonema papillatum]|nr:BRO1 domain-containing protein BROX-like protein [Diplonema papillatum]
MSDVVCLSFPPKATAELDFAKKVARVGRLKKMHALIFDRMTKARSTMVRAFAKKSPDVDAAAETYLSYLTAMLPPDGKACFMKSVLYFHWSPSFGPPTSHAVDDVTYEAASTLANVGIIHMMKARDHIATACRSSAERIEAEAYRMCCRAAGCFTKAHELASTMGEMGDDFPLDIHPAVVRGLASFCLAQAQELALAKASHNPENRGKELLGKLASRAHELYAEALQGFAGKTRLQEDAYYRLLYAIRVKKDLMQIKTFTLMAASHSKQNRMGEAKLSAQQAADLVAKAVAYDKAEKKYRDKNLTAALATALEQTKRTSYNVQRDAEILGKPAPCDGPLDLISPQVLAMPTIFEMPEMHSDWSPEVVAAFELK